MNGVHTAMLSHCLMYLGVITFTCDSMSMVTCRWRLIMEACHERAPVIIVNVDRRSQDPFPLISLFWWVRKMDMILYPV